MTFHIITLFADGFTSYLNESILARAQKEKKIKIKFYNPRDFVKLKLGALGPKSNKDNLAPKAPSLKPYLRIDDKPYGGGPGMVMQALPVIKAIAKAKGKNKNTKIIFLSPSGKQFNTTYAKATAKKYKEIIIVCGRYEGIDARIKKVFKMDDISVGPFVLTGGELPAMIIIDCIARQVKGVLGNFESLEESRVSSSSVYTRPEVIKYKGKNYRVPKVLVSGHHKKINEWKLKK